MFQKGLHYKNRRFSFKVLQIEGNKMLVLLENDEKAVLNLELQTRIQKNISTQIIEPYTPSKLPKRGKHYPSPRKQSISEWQINSLANLNKDNISGGIVVECLDCRAHSEIFGIDELRDFYFIHPKHNTRANGGYYDSNLISDSSVDTPQFQPK